MADMNPNKDPKILERWSKKNPIKVRTLPDNRVAELLDDDVYYAVLIRDQNNVPTEIYFAITSMAAFEKFMLKFSP